ncbi:MAG: ribosome maturation factor RimP [Myxococcales bacterium]|nr:ribosome maturation factor RimP [Myxococcales bacterium]MCB9709446.1 ribosome maturation factor RimP [Myxococcales bacterium]
MRALSDREQRLSPIIEPLCHAHGVRVVQIKYGREPGGGLLQIMIERLTDDDQGGQGGITLEDCVRVSRDVSVALDANLVLEGRYRLEVTSPGLERPLVAEQDFERFKGREIKVHTVGPVDGRRRFQGVLEGLFGSRIRLSQEGEPIDIALDNVKKAHLVYHFGRPTRHTGERHAEG